MSVTCRPTPSPSGIALLPRSSPRIPSSTSSTPENMFKEIRRVLAPDGVAIFATPDFARSFKTFYEDPSHIHPYVPGGLRTGLELAGFEVLHLSHLNVRRPLGRFPFLWRRYPKLWFTGSSIVAVARRGQGPPVA